MPEQEKESLVGVTAADITVDEAGRIIVANPQVAERLKAAAAAEPPRAAGNNCTCVNTVAGCGAKQQ